MAVSRKWLGEELVFTSSGADQTTSVFDVPIGTAVGAKGMCTTGGDLTLQVQREDGTTWDSFAVVTLTANELNVAICEAIPGAKVRAVLSPTSSGNGVVQVFARP